MRTQVSWDPLRALWFDWPPRWVRHVSGSAIGHAMEYAALSRAEGGRIPADLAWPPGCIPAASSIRPDQVKLTQTSGACPEQYDATDPSGKLIGYVRYRYGCFTVQCPDVNGFTLLELWIGDRLSGILGDNERPAALEVARVAIAAWCNGHTMGKWKP